MALVTPEIHKYVEISNIEDFVENLTKSIFLEQVLKRKGIQSILTQ
jgi:hypothetical protein